MSTQQIVKVNYDSPEFYFKVPEGTDLKDKSMVEEYWVSWNTLHIKYADGRVVEIDHCGETEPDTKCPVDTEVCIPGTEDHAFCMDMIVDE